LGQPVYQQIYVEFEQELPEIPEYLTNHIETLVSQAPSILQMRFDIYRRREDLNRHLNIYRERGVRPPRECDECDDLHEAYDRVTLVRNIATRAMGAELRTAYSNLEQLQAQETAARLALVQAEENLQTAQTNFDLGRVTQFEIDTAVFAIFSAQQAVERILNLQWGLALGLDNPVLL